MNISRLGETKNEGVMLKIGIFAGGNMYNMKKVCTVCGLPIRNSGRNADTCKDTYPGKQSKKILSQCQRIQMNIQTTTCRARDKARGVKRKQYLLKSHRIPMYKRAIRECLRCETKGKPTKFLSKGPFNRICERCTYAKSEHKEAQKVQPDKFKHLKTDRLFNPVI